MQFFDAARLINEQIDNIIRFKRHRKFIRLNRKICIANIRSKLIKLGEGHVLIVGNSHAEFIGEPVFGARQSINIGIGGANARDCLAELKRLDFSVKIAAIVLFIGTNDIARWNYPNSTISQRRFAACVRSILNCLDTISNHVFVAAIPPVSPKVLRRDPTFVELFSNKLEAACKENNHFFIDPFANLRSRRYGSAQSGLHSDGVHIADYAAIADQTVKIVLDKIGPAV